MGMTKEMAKYKRRTEKEEEKARSDARQAVYSGWVVKDQEILDANKATKEAEDKAIAEEVERQYQDYLVSGEPVFIASRSTRQLAILNDKNKLKEERKATIPKILANPGARKVINEEALALGEKYTIQRSDLGKGTYGLVYRAENPAKRPIACKVTSLGPLPSQYRFRLQAGFNILRFLKDHPHPNIMPIIEIFESPDKTYVFMEAFETDLFKRIKKEGPFKEKEGLRIGKEVAAGLLYLHRIGVAHENLKSHHIMFKGRGPAVITGFGWAVVAYDGDKDEVIRQKGSAKQKFHHDFAPEKMLDDVYDPSAADVWSFGALLVSILTKEHPYEPKSQHRVDVQWKLAFKKAGVRLTDRVHDLLDTCFSLEPTARGSMIDVMAHFDK